ncbi:MAG: hypothetical protein CMI54_04685 [Parcubacteria group bacterium]|nr:hypothetical protein [Parcubacteria group bacterium]|tara:strand:+ start:2656 stop:2844 length:189 start_codon:yes stop_codon:yes gene_type:complete
MNKLKYNFGNIVVVEDSLVGVIVKCWEDKTYDVYVRSWSGVSSYPEVAIEPFIYDKVLEDEN